MNGDGLILRVVARYEELSTRVIHADPVTATLLSFIDAEVPLTVYLGGAPEFEFAASLAVARFAAADNTWAW